MGHIAERLAFQVDRNLYEPRRGWWAITTVAGTWKLEIDHGFQYPRGERPDSIFTMRNDGVEMVLVTEDQWNAQNNNVCMCEENETARMEWFDSHRVMMAEEREVLAEMWSRWDAIQMIAQCHVS